MKDSTLRAIVAMAGISLSEGMLWSIAFFQGRDGALIAGIGAMSALIAGLGGYIAIRSGDGALPTS